MEKSAKNLLIYSKKVLNYRKHAMSTETFLKISQTSRELGCAISDGSYKNAKQTINELKELLTKNGGDIYPVRPLNDNCEVLLVTSIIAIAIRVFFLQSFQIPTNSMFPTYSGVKIYVHNDCEPQLSMVKKIYNKIFNGTKKSFHINSDHSGMLKIPLFKIPASSNGIVKFDIQNKNRSPERVYKLKIGKNFQEIRVSSDECIDDALLQKFGLGYASWQELYNEHPEKFKITQNCIYYKTGIPMKAGKQLINFDIVCGDILFVDKFSYHFHRPTSGEAIVFHTEKIKNIPGEPRYFVKRLVGEPSDEIQLKDGILRKNGAAIGGSKIFDNENKKINGYNGYTAIGLLDNNNTVHVGKKEYFVLGDNSADSGDSRFWGFVPEREICGRPFFTFYPLNRAGFCK